MKYLLLLILLLATPAVAQTVTIGDTAVETAIDNGNGGLVIAQGPYSPAQNGALQSLSFYVTTASGQMYLALYADNGGVPFSMLTSTAVFMPTAGWNTQPALSSPLLSTTSKYWLVYAPSSNTLTFRKQNNSGSCFYFPRSFQVPPTLWPSAGVKSCTPTTWSFYATINTAPPPPPPPPQTVFTGPYSQVGGAVGTATCMEINAGTLNCVLVPPLQSTSDLTVGPVQ
jgi:hypothetical protein